MKPFFSVIVPVYNVEKYLNKCLDSIVNQSFDNFELILINDGSTDSSKEICLKYSKKDSRIVFIDQLNLGVSACRNKGLSYAKGEYYTFIDSDDWIALNFFEKVFDYLRLYDTDIVECNHYIVDKSQIIGKNSNKIIEGDNILALNRLIEGKSSNVVWGKFYKKSLFNEIRFPINRIYEDGFIMWKLFLNCKSYVYMNTSFYYHLKREGSIMSLQKKYSFKNLDGLISQQERYYALKSMKNILKFDELEVRYFSELLYHYKNLMNDSSLDKNCVYKNLIIQEILSNSSSFLKNKHIKKSKILIFAIRTHHCLFNKLIKYFYK